MNFFRNLKVLILRLGMRGTIDYKEVFERSFISGRELNEFGDKNKDI